MRLLAVACAFVVLAGCFGGGDDDGESDGEDEVPGALTHLGEPFQVEMAGLTPVAVAPLLYGGVLVAALDGGVYHIDANDTLSAEPIVDLPAVEPDGEKGLLGLAVPPPHLFLQSPRVYAFFTDPPPAAGPQTQRVVAFRWTAGVNASEPEDVVTGLPASPACCHNGGRIAFDDDGLLYVSVGDNMVQADAQNPASARGKVLRYTAEGVSRGVEPTSPVVVSGLRNPFGLWVDKPSPGYESERHLGIVVTDNGPSAFDGPGGLDEVNVFQEGDNGGWPAGRGDGHLPGHTPPVWHSGEEHVAPTGVVVPREPYHASANETLLGKIVWCNFNDGKAWWLDAGAADPAPVELWPECRYDVKVDAFGRMVYATDGAVWFVP